eukprot:SAG22_NODE_494_length_9810_cov_2.202966_9_plen_462_part_00
MVKEATRRRQLVTVEETDDDGSRPTVASTSSSSSSVVISARRRNRRRAARAHLIGLAGTVFAPAPADDDSVRNESAGETGSRKRKNAPQPHEAGGSAFAAAPDSDEEGLCRAGGTMFAAAAEDGVGGGDWGPDEGSDDADGFDGLSSSSDDDGDGDDDSGGDDDTVSSGEGGIAPAGAASTTRKKQKKQKKQGTTHPVWVKRTIPCTSESEALACNWKLTQLADGEGIEEVSTAEADGGVAVTVGPFVLQRSGAQGQELQQFYDAILGANTVISSLLWCFACLAAEQGEEPEVTFDEADQVKNLLEAELEERTHTHEGLAAQVVQDALANLAIMVQDSAPLSEEHQKVYISANPVLSDGECRQVIAAAEAEAGAYGESDGNRHDCNHSQTILSVHDPVDFARRDLLSCCCNRAERMDDETAHRLPDARSAGECARGSRPAARAGSDEEAPAGDGPGECEEQ